MRMEEYRDLPAKNLSFGNERKLEIVIALAVEPEVLLMDEPAAGMSPDELLESDGAKRTYLGL